jgi:hypothetical protein
MAPGTAAPGTEGLSRGHRIARFVIAFGIGLALAVYAYRLVTDPELAAERERQEAVVASSRDLLRTYVDGDELEIVDPLEPDSKVGKSYLYPADDGWEVSGHYRRGPGDTWHPYLMQLDASAALIELSVKDDDGALRRRAVEDPKLTVTP